MNRDDYRGGAMKGKRSAQAREEAAARHIRYELEQREWSTAKLARLVTEAGVPIHQSAVWRIAYGDPPRKITLAESFAFAEVFDMALETMVEFDRFKKLWELATEAAPRANLILSRTRELALTLERLDLEVRGRGKPNTNLGEVLAQHIKDAKNALTAAAQVLAADQRVVERIEKGVARWQA
jgi:hypothetical protein